jgi:hypothetical protein
MDKRSQLSARTIELMGAKENYPVYDLLMTRKKKQAWGIGDIFCIPLADGTYSIGQVVGKEPEALNSAIGAFFSRRFDNCPAKLDSELSEDELLAVLFVTRDLLDSGVWKVFSHAEAFPIQKYVSVSSLKAAGFVGVEIIGSGNVKLLMDAYYSLCPWNGFYEPDYLDQLLVSADKKPSSVLLK